MFNFFHLIKFQYFRIRSSEVFLNQFIFPISYRQIQIDNGQKVQKGQKYEFASFKPEKCVKLNFRAQ